MDPYYSRNAPSDRTWNSRDDIRRDDREYRRQPANYDRERDRDFGRERDWDRNYPRTRSRSPNLPTDRSVDRYEPRPRRRDDYGARDVEDRPPRHTPVASSPVTIDRYVPGQSFSSPVPTLLTTNPVPDPLTLSYQVGFSYFSEWWRMNEKVKEDKERARSGRRAEPEKPKSSQELQEEKERIQAAYDSYKDEFQGRMAQAFVAEHKSEMWFRERYDPQLREQLQPQLHEYRHYLFSQWEQELDSGFFDEHTLEGIPKAEANSAGDREEGEATGSEMLGVGDLVAVTEELRDENLYKPTLLFKTIAPNVSRAKLEEFCKEHLGEGDGGLRWLSLSDPNPNKRFHRIGWVVLNPAGDAMTVDRDDTKDEEDEEGEASSNGNQAHSNIDVAVRAQEAINSKTVQDEDGNDFTCHVGVHNPPTLFRKKALWDLFSDPERIERDLFLATKVVGKLEETAGFEMSAAAKIQERVQYLQSSGQLRASYQEEVSGAQKSKKNKNQAKKQNRSSRDVDGDEVLGEDGDGEVDVEEGEEEEEEGEEEDEGAIEEEEEGNVDEEQLSVQKKELDLTVEYLRRVFNFCFFCVFESDSVYELTRKCPGGHLRRPRSSLTTSSRMVARASARGETFPELHRDDDEAAAVVEGGSEVGFEQPSEAKKTRSKTEQQLQRAYNWVKTFEDKLNQILEPESVDVRKLGGKPMEDVLTDELAKFHKQEDENKWRCKVGDCSKLFREYHFWRKHVEKRHTEWLDGIKLDHELVNAYVLDPAHILPARPDATSNGHFSTAHHGNPSGTPRGFNMHSYAFHGAASNHTMSPGGSAMGSMSGMRTGPGGVMHYAPGPVRRNQNYGMNNHMAGGTRNFRSGPYDRRGGGVGGPGRFDDGHGRSRNYNNNSNYHNNNYHNNNNNNHHHHPGSGPGGPTNTNVTGPREAVQGRSLKSYEDLDQAMGMSSNGQSELNY